MIEPNLKYLQEHFLSLEELANNTGMTSAEILAFVKSDKIPQASYTVRTKVTIDSPIGDGHSFDQTTLYFPKSYIRLIMEIENRNGLTAKHEFITRMKEHLKRHPSKKLAYQDAGSIYNDLNQVLKTEWDAYQKGIYGICTLNATPEEVIEKEIAVKKLLQFIETHPEDTWKNYEDELSQIIAEYDKVSNLFAPYQRESSSRGKYVDRPLRVLGRLDKIKNY